MTAVMVVLLRLRDAAWVADYATNVPAIVRRHGGEYRSIAKAGSVRQVEGGLDPPTTVVVFEFSSTEAARAFLDAPDYQPFKAARQAGSDSDILIFENDDDAPQFIRHRAPTHSSGRRVEQDPDLLGE